ncbi:MAG: hypothetical protein IJU40_06470 [Desulfovibrionaceae bacterium]|nr:hypothetical protein [Desulfovibrionaceae bacterium]
MHPRKWYLLLTLVLLGLILNLTACGPFLGHIKQDDPNRERFFALALPLTGPHAQIALKIRQGARSAEQELLKHGVKVKLVIIDTGKKDWIQKVAALPETCVVVGGPLDLTSYKNAKKAHLLERKTFFAFLNNLEANDEGRLAFRFFPSAQDQIESLIGFASGPLKIRAFGAFYPSDSYSLRMVNLFEAEAKRKNLPVYKATYNASMPSSWSQSAKSLVNPVSSGEGSSKVLPRTTFEGVFLPGSWKHLDNIITSFMRNGESRLVLLGTILWEQSIANRAPSTPQRFELAMFPGAWNNQIKLPPQAGPNNFWVSLGYDFVRFASNMGLVKQLSPIEVVERANRSSKVIRSLAPISWDQRGIAKQRLFIYRVSTQGMVKIDPEFFNQLRNTRKANAALTFQSEPQGSSEVGAPSSGSLGDLEETPSLESPKPELPKADKRLTPQIPSNSPALSTVPQSSHKLRLPTARTAPVEP